MRGLERAFFFVYLEVGLNTVSREGVLAPLEKSHLGGKLKSYRLDMEIEFLEKAFFQFFSRHFNIEEKSHTVNVPPHPDVSATLTMF